jgi:hypothetical protein
MESGKYLRLDLEVFEGEMRGRRANLVNQEILELFAVPDFAEVLIF